MCELTENSPKEPSTHMSDDKKTLKFQMMMSLSEAEVLDDWMFRNRVRSRAEAIRRLTQIALALEPFVYDLQGLWQDVQKADSELNTKFLEAWASLDTIPTEDLLRTLDDAGSKIVPAALELGIHASLMTEVFDAMKSGQNVEVSMARAKAQIKDRAEVRDFVRKTWGSSKDRA